MNVTPAFGMKHICVGANSSERVVKENERCRPARELQQRLPHFAPLAKIPSDPRSRLAVAPAPNAISCECPVDLKSSPDLDTPQAAPSAGLAAELPLREAAKDSGGVVVAHQSPDRSGLPDAVREDTPGQVAQAVPDDVCVCVCVWSACACAPEDVSGGVQETVFIGTDPAPRHACGLAMALLTSVVSPTRFVQLGPCVSLAVRRLATTERFE